MGGWLQRLLVVLSGITLVLVIAYILLVQDERTMQAEVNQRQQFINQSLQLGRVNEALIRALAANAAKDDKLRELLAQNGISINAVTGAPERETTPPSPAPAGTPR
jgi:type II secretory pathway component PulM